MENVTNSKEREQLIVFNALKKEGISQKEAANRLKVSDRWVRKKFRRFICEGAAGLPHKNRGVQSKKCWNKEDQSIAIELLKTDWQGFGPTFAAEKLQALQGITVSKET